MSVVSPSPMYPIGEEHQADAEHGGSRNPVGEQPRRIARQRVHRVVADVGQDHLDDREADLVEPQQQQRIGEVHHPERDQQRRSPASSGRAVPAPGEQCPPARPRLTRRGLAHQEHQRDAAAPPARRPPTAAARSDGRAVRSRPARAAGRPPRPAVSIARWNRTPVRGRPSSTPATSSASRGAPRNPLPSRSTTRPASTPGHAAAAATITLPSAAMP